jgi:hypothetical protein
MWLSAVWSAFFALSWALSASSVPDFVTKNRKDCDHDCNGGGCNFEDCENGPNCGGGACIFTRCVNPSCDGGACIFIESTGATCRGGIVSIYLVSFF